MKLPKLIFLHIPKTAGSTFRNLISRLYPSDFHFVIRGFHENVFKELSYWQRRKYRLLSGHQNFGMHRYMPGRARYVTFLRDPVDRIVSHYFHIQNKPNLENAIHKLAYERPIEEFIELDFPQLNNHQTRMIYGSEATTFTDNFANPEALLAQAKKNINKHFLLVGTQSEFEKSIELFLSKIGRTTEIQYKTKNTGSRPAGFSISEAAVERIRERHKLDLQLLEFAKEKYGL